MLTRVVKNTGSHRWEATVGQGRGVLDGLRLGGGRCLTLLQLSGTKTLHLRTSQEDLKELQEGKLRQRQDGSGAETE